MVRLLIKDRNNLNQIFLKKKSRIEAMLMVMGMTLFVNNLAQKTLREHLTETAPGVPIGLAGKPTSQFSHGLLT